jgi:hypothetical protein
VDKGVGNFCEYFQFRVGERSVLHPTRDDARAQLNSLFGPKK